MSCDAVTNDDDEGNLIITNDNGVKRKWQFQANSSNDNQ
jgi:hypothetical protein